MAQAYKLVITGMDDNNSSVDVDSLCPRLTDELVLFRMTRCYSYLLQYMLCT